MTIEVPSTWAPSTTQMSRVRYILKPKTSVPQTYQSGRATKDCITSYHQESEGRKLRVIVRALLTLESAICTVSIHDSVLAYTCRHSFLKQCNATWILASIRAVNAGLRTSTRRRPRAFPNWYHGLSSPRTRVLTRQCHRRLPLDRPLQPARTKAYLPERTSKIRSHTAFIINDSLRSSGRCNLHRSGPSLPSL
jgi:hypothetical protein